MGTSGYHELKNQEFVRVVVHHIGILHVKRKRRKNKMNIEPVKTSIQKVKVTDILFDTQIYARMNPDQALIVEYSENIDSILASGPKIQVASDMRLIDGYHRWKAAQTAKGDDFEIDVLVHDTDNSDYIELTSYAANTKHGQRNSKKENTRNIQRLYRRGYDIDQIKEHLSLSRAMVNAATKADRDQEKQERNDQIISMYLQAWNTHRSIADEMDLTKKVVSDVLSKLVLSATESEKDQNSKKEPFKKFIYRTWNQKDQDNTTRHFGAFPEIYMQNLLAYCTKPFDIVFDPFGGGGTTVDICKEMFRRYYVSDRKVIPGRENDIRQHDIKEGLPADLQKPDIVFLDPPYWKQAQGQYSDDGEDLSNMSLESFNASMKKLFDEIGKKKIQRIAIVIQPTQYLNNWQTVDHTIDFAIMLQKKYVVESRRILPYSTQQYNAQMINKAKEQNDDLVLHRDLTVFKLRQ